MTLTPEAAPAQVEDEAALRAAVRAFLATELPWPQRYGTGVSGGPGYMDFAPEFSRKLAAKGWVGMSIPPQYGGHSRGSGRGFLERFIVIEELLAAGAPLLAHWIGDRQTAPMLLAFGTEEQRQRFLPSIAAGELSMALGFSEPDSGSDLASVRCRAVKVDGGWSLQGMKTWTSGAHTNKWIIVLARTGDLPDDRHRGLSLLLADLQAPGVTIKPILFPDGGYRFNEVFFDDVFVPDDMLLGEAGEGWELMRSELAHERAGPERFLAAWPLFEAYLSEHRRNVDENLVPIGRIAARFWALRQLALSVARGLEQDRVNSLNVSLLKDLGTTFEQEVVADLQAIVQDDPDPGAADVFELLLARALVMAPSWTITGGTTEVLRSIAARQLRSIPGPQASSSVEAEESPLDETLNQLFEQFSGPEDRQRAEEAGWAESCWDALSNSGFQWVGVPESAGGSGGGLEDATALVRLAGQHAVALPVAECTMVGGWLMGEAGLQVPTGAVTVASPLGAASLRIDAGLTVSGTLERVAWGSRATSVLAIVSLPEGPAVVVLDPRTAEVRPGRNVAGEPRDTLVFDRVSVSREAVVPISPETVDELVLRGGLSRSLLMAGAARAVSDMTVAYAQQRKQFGREIITFQAVSGRLVQLVGEANLASLSAVAAAHRLGEVGGAADFDVAAAKATAGRAVSAVAAHAHQIHAAMGMTQEYPLHHFTRRMWTWRQEWGTEQYWARRAGQRIVGTQVEELYPLIATGPVRL